MHRRRSKDIIDLHSCKHTCTYRRRCTIAQLCALTPTHTHSHTHILTQSLDLTHTYGRWKSRLYSRDSLHHFVDGIENGEQIAAFPPGSMVHIKVTQVAKPLCLGYCYPNRLAVERISSEDLCVMIMDRGMIDDHLPNAVLNALKRCKKEFLPNHQGERFCNICTEFP